VLGKIYQKLFSLNPRGKVFSCLARLSENFGKLISWFQTKTRGLSVDSVQSITNLVSNQNTGEEWLTQVDLPRICLFYANRHASSIIILICLPWKISFLNFLYLLAWEPNSAVENQLGPVLVKEKFSIFQFFNFQN